MHRSVGPQYVRGISHWADDDSRGRAGDVARLQHEQGRHLGEPCPDPPGRFEVTDDGDATWNVYSPKWAPVTAEGDEVRLEDRDPYDDAVATRCSPRGARSRSRSRSRCSPSNPRGLHVEPFGRGITGVRRPRIPAMRRASGGRIGWSSPSLRHVTFRTGEPRGVGGTKPVPPGSDCPCRGSHFGFGASRCQLT